MCYKVTFLSSYCFPQKCLFIPFMCVCDGVSVPRKPLCQEKVREKWKDVHTERRLRQADCRMQADQRGHWNGAADGAEAGSGCLRGSRLSCGNKQNPNFLIMQDQCRSGRCLPNNDLDPGSLCYVVPLLRIPHFLSPQFHPFSIG